VIRRELVLLAVVAGDEPPVSARTRLQKYVFLVQERADVHPYEFRAYDYGPFSRAFYDDVDELLRRCWLEEIETERDDGTIWYYYGLGEAAPDVEEHVDEDLLDVAREVREEFDDRPLDELIESIYSEYPRMAKNSVF
jgi:uncharacterized protein YwgA